MKINSNIIKQRKKLLLPLFSLFFILFSLPLYATDTEQAITLLNKMSNAVKTQNYQLYFVTQERDQYVTTYQYSHLGNIHLGNINGDSKSNDFSQSANMAHLLHLEGSAKEIILHNNITSYFQPESASFSISSPRIVEAFPDVVYNDFNRLTDVYDFILLGKTRTANRSVQLVKIIAKERDRYSYIIWIDDETYLPLRIDLNDLNNELLQQMKVIELNRNFNTKKMLDYISNRTYPILLAIEKKSSESDEWRLSWLPKGFKEMAAYNVNFYNSDIATKLYSDGIFSFTVNVSDEKSNQSNQVIKQGGKTIFSTNLNRQNIIIIGDLPLTTIERIAQSIDNVQKSH
ncbi:MucB/RseB C-terminal domain-containing protein [Orbaceae bacterium ESL0721]|nr:MucB/RseB C-terminal domain-containing protein [Orbaceae bacterium ESL0721]